MANTQTFEIIICDQYSTPSLKMGEYLLDKEKGIMYVGSDIPIERVDIKTFCNLAFGIQFRSSLQKMFVSEIIDVSTVQVRTSTDMKTKIYVVIKMNDNVNIYLGYGTQIPHLSFSVEKV